MIALELAAGTALALRRPLRRALTLGLGLLTLRLILLAVHRSGLTRTAASAAATTTTAAFATSAAGSGLSFTGRAAGGLGLF